MCLLATAERCRAADLGLGLLTLLRQVRVLLCQLALLRRRALLGRQLQPSESQQLLPVAPRIIAADGRVRASARVGGDALAEQRPPLIRGACHHFSHSAKELSFHLGIPMFLRRASVVSRARLEARTPALAR